MRLVYLSPVPWENFNQRPHHFVCWWHERTGGQVLWVDPYPTRLPVLSDFRAAGKGTFPRGKEQPEWLRLERPRALPLEPLPFSCSINRLFWGQLQAIVDRFVAGKSAMLGVGKPSALALQLLAERRWALSLYDMMDDFPSFYRGISRKSMVRRENELLGRVDVVFASSSRLMCRLRGMEKKIRFVPNGCVGQGLPAIPANRSIRSKVVFGYVGTIAGWFDWQYILELARRLPEAQILLAGPVHCNCPERMPDNVALLPPCPHHQALELMRTFSVGLIPFLETPLTAAVDPVKYYEYRSLGLPVLSTVFGEMALRSEERGVYLVDSLRSLPFKAKEALAYTEDPACVARFREENSWNSRFDASGIV